MGSLQIIKDDIVLDFYSSSMETVYAKQSDTGRVLKISLQEAGKEYQIPSGVTARISSGTFWNECTIQDNKVVAPLSSDMLYSGRRPCQIELMMGEDKVSTANFILYTEASARDDNAIMGSNKYGVLDGLIDKAFNDAEQTGKDAAQTAADRKATGADRTAVAADRKAVEKINNDFTLTAQQATADVNNAGQTQTQRVNTAGDTQVSRIQAEGTTQVQNVQATAAEIAADREQIHTNRDNVARLQRTTAGAITRSAEGSFITLEDSADEMGFRRLEIAGETEQVTTTGAQMIDFEQCLKNWKSQYTQVGGRVYKITAIGAGYQAPVAFSESDIKVTLSGIIRDLSGSGYRVDLIDSSGNIVGRINKDIKSVTGLASKIRLNFAEAGAGEYSDIMLNAGSAAIPWEPYTGSKPSPSPEYPQEMENVGVLNEAGKYKVKVTACKNNLLDMTRAKGGTNAGITATVNPDGSFTSNGTATNGAINIWLLGNYIQNYTDKNILMVLAPGKTYRIVDVVLFTGTDYAISPGVFYVDPKKYPDGYKVTGVRHPTLDSGTVLTNKVYHPRVILGDTDTGWEPYRGHTATITSDRPLTKWDKLTCRDGVWGWRYKGRDKTYTGSQPERWMAYSNTVHKVARCYRMEAYNLISYASGDAALNADINIMCDRFIFGGYVGRKENVSIGYSEGQYMYIRLDDEAYAEIDTVDKFRAWLAEHPITVQYETDTETWVPLTAKEQAAMNALCTYAGTTYIWTDDPLQPVISLDYTVDTETYIKDTTPAYRDVERFALTGEASGAVATCTDSADWPLLGVGMLGKCEQLTTTGANLFGGRALADKIMEVAPGSIIDEDKGTITFASNIISGKTLYDNFEPNKRYTIILCGKNTDQNYTATNLRLTYDDGINVSLSFQTANTYSYCVYSSTVNKTVVSISGTWVASKTELQYDKCGIFEGAIDLASFEPYTGAAPSPSPAYPQEIQETGTYNPEMGMYEADMVMTGAQLFDLEQWLKQVKVEYAKDNSGITITGSGGIYANPMSFAKTDTEVTLSGKLEVLAGTNYRFELLDQNMNVVGSFFSGSKPITAIASKIRMNYYNIGKCRISDIMINKGSTALPWEPYKGMQSLRLTADQPWRGIGDVHDEVCDRDGVLGTWRRFAEDILDGSEDEKWEITDCSDSAHKRFCSGLIRPKTKPAALNAGVEPLLCNAYKAISANDTYSKSQGISVEVTGKIPIYDNTFSPTADLSGFKAHLAEHPIIVVYQLKEPYFEPFPEDVQKQYRKLKSYAGTTHAWVDDPLQPEVSFRYIKDSKLVLGKLEDRLTALEAGQAQTVAAFSYLPPETQAAMIENETRDLLSTIQEEEK